MSTITLRSVKNAPLSNTEVDNNFTNLNTDKLELGGTYSGGTANGVPYLNGSKAITTGSALTFDGSTLNITGTATMDGLTVDGEANIGSSGTQVRINSSSTTGIIELGGGTTDVIRSSAATDGLRFDSGGPYKRLIIANNGDISFYNSSGFSQAFFWDASAERLGIGTTTPTDKVQVIGDVLIGTNSGSSFNGNSDLKLQNTGNVYIQIKAGTASEAGLLFGDTDDSFVGGMRYSNATDALLFNAGNVERISVSATEFAFNDVGADTDFRVESDTNSHALFVDAGNNNIKLGTASALSDAGQASLELLAGANSVFIDSAVNGQNLGIYFKHQTTLGSPQTRVGSAIIDIPTGTYTAGTGSTYSSDLTLSVAAANVQTEVVRATSTKYLRMASGTGGIQFNGDTAAANALDDYETGTWTPALQGVTATYTTQTGTYTKIGRQVTCSVLLVVSSLDTADSSGFSVNVPFVSSATDETSVLFSATNRYNKTNLVPSTATTFINGGARLINSGTVVAVRAPYTTGTDTTPRYSEMNASGEVSFTFSYYV